MLILSLARWYSPLTTYHQHDLYCYRAGGLTSTFFTSPLDVVKTRLQSDFYRHQLEARRYAKGLNTVRAGLFRQGARHFLETFQILAYVLEDNSTLDSSKHVELLLLGLVGKCGASRVAGHYSKVLAQTSLGLYLHGNPTVPGMVDIEADKYYLLKGNKLLHIR